jgi:hypothetical protein
LQKGDIEGIISVMYLREMARALMEKNTYTGLSAGCYSIEEHSLIFIANAKN